MNERAAAPSTPYKPEKPEALEKRVAANCPAMVSPVRGRDREFLPAALEILETPPSPLAVALMLTICAFFAAALIWSYFGRLDVHAVAPGKIETAGRAKVMQPFESGKIAAIHVSNGQKVKAGDVLMEIDPAEALADAGVARDQRFEDLAEVARRGYAVVTARSLGVGETDTKATRGFEAGAINQALAKAETGIGFPDDIPEPIRLRQRSVLAADLNELSDQLVALDKQIAQKEATSQRLNMGIAFEDQLMVTLTDRVKTRQDAIDLNVGTKINLYDAKEELEKSQSQLASDQGQLIETEAALNALSSEKFKAISQFVAYNENKAVDVARKAEDAGQALSKANAKLSRTRFVAPVDGVAQQLAVTTIGQVVTTGQQLLVVTPMEGPLQVEALVANQDIGFVKLGQTAVVKVDAFPFTRFGALTAKVVGIARQAVDETEAKRAFADVTAPSNGVPPPTSAPGQSESFVFPVTLMLDKAAIDIGGTDVLLNPGMTVSVEIKTDSRRVIDYLLSPLSKVASEALRER